MERDFPPGAAAVADACWSHGHTALFRTRGSRALRLRCIGRPLALLRAGSVAALAACTSAFRRSLLPLSNRLTGWPGKRGPGRSRPGELPLYLVFPLPANWLA